MISVATAANWEYVGDSRNTGMIYVDTASIAKSPFGRKAWVRVEFYSPQEVNNRKHSSGISLYHCDCQGRSLSVVKMAFYSGDNRSGDIVYSWSGKPTKDSLEDVMPDTVEEMILDFVCSFKNSKR
ncbi:surface-adhesin E family protein [Verminephrobacter aporrectodeae]